MCTAALVTLTLIYGGSVGGNVVANISIDVFPSPREAWIFDRGLGHLWRMELPIP